MRYSLPEASYARPGVCGASKLSPTSPSSWTTARPTRSSSIWWCATSASSGRSHGTTAATEVVLRIEPKPQRASASQEGYKDLWLPDRIPTLVPGQEWRQLWDFTPERVKTDLPERHEAVVTFKDSRGEEHRFEYILDWGATRSRMYVTTYGVHHGVKALREISKTLSKSR